MRKFEKILQKLWEKYLKFCCTTMQNCRPKIIVYVSCIKFLGSCMYCVYTIHDVFVYRVPNSVRDMDPTRTMENDVCSHNGSECIASIERRAERR